MRFLRPCLAPALLLLTTAAMSAVEPPAPSCAQAAPAPEFTVDQLERAFWVCDYLATTQGVHGTHVAACRYATDELKRVKFGGSFRNLLQWWRENKAAEHRKLAEGTAVD